MKIRIKSLPKAQNGANIPEVNGTAPQNATSELEKGEVYQAQNGGINKISEDGNTHEDGGVPVNDAQKVLEDTSDKRKDIHSQLLKMNPQDIKSTTGLDQDKELSHSKAFEKSKEYWDKVLSRVESKLKKNVASVKESGSIYAQNSMDLNLKTLNKIPTQGDLFDSLFDHQETTKAQYGIVPEDNKAQVGADYTGQDPNALNSKLQANLSKQGGSPTPSDSEIAGYLYGIGKLDSKVSSYFTGHIQNYNRSENPDFNSTGQGRFNKAAFTAKPTNAVAPLTDFSKNLFGTTDTNSNAKANGDAGSGLKGKGNFGYNPKTGTIVPANNTATPKYVVPQTGDNQTTTTPRQVGNPLDALVHQNQPQFTTNSQAVVDKTLTGQTSDNTDNSTSTTSVGSTKQPFDKSEFNQPLQWYDVAGPINQLLDSGRLPITYNPVNVHESQVRKLNPQPELDAHQADFNAAVQNLPDSGIGYANKANLASRKYSIDNQVLGQYENINKGKEDQNDAAHAAARNTQEQSDQQSRQTFESKYLKSLEAQRQQKQTAYNELYSTIAQNAKLNREGNLMMKMFDYVDQNGNYNGNQYYLREQSGAPPQQNNGQPQVRIVSVPTSTGKQVQVEQILVNGKWQVRNAPVGSQPKYSFSK